MEIETVTDFKELVIKLEDVEEVRELLGILQQVDTTTSLIADIRRKLIKVSKGPMLGLYKGSLTRVPY